MYLKANCPITPPILAIISTFYVESPTLDIKSPTFDANTSTIDNNS